MPRKPDACLNCKLPCRGTRCRHCAKAHFVRGYSRTNAQKQKFTAVLSPPKAEPRDSWWTRYGQADFTAVARVMVKPETRTNYSRYVVVVEAAIAKAEAEGH